MGVTVGYRPLSAWVSSVADSYACSPAVQNDARPVGRCSVGMVETNPTLVVFQTEIPDASALVAVFTLGFFVNFGGAPVIAHTIRQTVRLIKKL